MTVSATLYARPVIVRGQQCAGARLHVERCCTAAQAARRHVSSPRSGHRLPSAEDAATRARFGPPSRRPPPSWPSRMSGRRPRRSSLSPPCGRPSTWSRGRLVSTRVRCPGDRCPRVRCSRVRCSRVRCDPGVRTDRRPDRRASGVRGLCVRAVRTALDPEVGAAGQPRFGGPGSTCRCGPRAAWSSLPECGLAGKRWSCVGSAWLARGSTAGLGRRFAVAPAAAPRSPPGRPRELVQRQGAGRLAGEHAREQALTSPSQVRLGQVAGVLLDHGRDRKVVTTLRGRCAGVGLRSSGAGGPVRFSGA
jgi:hypothetical protein